MPYTLCPMLSSIFVVFMSMVGVRPMVVCVVGFIMLMPMTVVDGWLHSWKWVTVMSIVVAMPVFMCNRFVMVEVMVLFEKQQCQRDCNNQRCNYLSGRNRFSEKKCSKDDSKEGRAREDDLTAGSAKFLGRSYKEDQA